MATFGDLGLGENLRDALASLGIRSPNAFQAEALPVLLRGTAAVAVASAGSGKTLAYALALLERIDPESPLTQALVLRPTDDRSAHTALLLHRLGRARDVVVTALWPDRLEETARGQVVVGSPGRTLEAVRRSWLKLDAARVLIVDGLSDLLEWGAGAALDTLAASLPKEAQRVVFTPRLTDEAADWLERYLRRARRLGAPGAAGAAGIGAPEPRAPERTAEEIVDAPDRGIAHVASLLEAARAKGIPRAALFCRTQGEAEAIADELAVRGFDLAPGEAEPGTSVVWDEDVPIEGALSISLGAPFDAGTLRRRTDGAARAVFIVRPGEQPHLRAAADAARVRLQPARVQLPEEAIRSLEELRARVRAALADRDTAPYLLALEPLFAERPPATVAAALAALLRERTPEAAEAPSVQAWTRLYFAVGRKDGVRPADLVGCIAGESGIAGGKVGRIDIRETFSVVEVSAEVAERVLRSLANATLRGRAVNARPFREHA